MKNIAEQNELIARFMEWNEGENSTKECLFFEAWDEVTDQVTIAELKFHLDWNWIMPVVDKISEISAKENVDDKLQLWMFLTNDIDSVFAKSVEFIEWYNQNK